MILKLAEGKRWIFIDGVKRIFAERGKRKEFPHEQKEHAMIFRSYDNTEESKKDEIEVLDILVIYNDETGKQIITDDVAFLLNDEGKTIERL